MRIISHFIHLISGVTIVEIMEPKFMDAQNMAKYEAICFACSGTLKVVDTIVTIVVTMLHLKLVCSQRHHTGLDASYKKYFPSEN